MIAHWGTFNKDDSLDHCHALAAAALADEGLQVEDTSADGPQFLLGSGPGLVTTVFLYPAAALDTRVTVMAFSDDAAAAEGARNRVRQRISENLFFPSTASPWAVLLCKFDDDATEPFAHRFYEDLFTASGTGTHNMVDYFRDVSHRRIDTSGTQVFGWLTLPKARADYTGSGANPAGRDELVTWARDAATSDGVDLSSFVGVVVCMNVQTDLFGGGGRVVCDNASMEPSVLAQEMGHGYGIDHSRTDGSTDDYTDRWDTMSTWDGCFMAPHPEYSIIGPGLNAANMSGRGWLDEARVWNAGAAVDATVTLRPLVRFDLPGTVAARVGPYLVEVRVKESWDAAIPEPAVLIHRFEGNHSYLMASTEGRQDLVRGSVFQVGSESSPFQPWTRVEVTDIDPAAPSATLHVTNRPVIDFPVPEWPAQTMGDAPGNSGGWVVLGGKAVPIPPQSPSFELLTQLAGLHAGGGAARRDQPEPEAGGGPVYTSPAPRSHSTEGRAELGTGGTSTGTGPS